MAALYSALYSLHFILGETPPRRQDGEMRWWELRPEAEKRPPGFCFSQWTERDGTNVMSHALAAVKKAILARRGERALVFTCFYQGGPGGGP
jgi:hypothetical protein